MGKSAVITDSNISVQGANTFIRSLEHSASVGSLKLSDPGKIGKVLTPDVRVHLPHVLISQLWVQLSQLSDFPIS